MKYHILDLNKYKEIYGKSMGEISPFDAGIPLVDMPD